MLRKPTIFFIFGGVFLLVLQACNVKKFVPEGKLLYEGAELEINPVGEIKDLPALKDELTTVLRPEPNDKILGMRLPLWAYYKAHGESANFINKFIYRKIGEEPVYASEVAPLDTEELLENRLENRGFFYSEINSEILRYEERKEAKARYTIELPEPYVLENYELDEVDSLQLYSEIRQFLPESPIDSGIRFDLSAMKLERERIDTRLKKEGYYFFNPNFLIFEADTNQYDEKEFGLYLRLKKDVPKKSIIPYRVEEVNVYPNYVLGNDSLDADIVRYDSINYIQEEEFFKPKRLDPYILIDEGGLYNPEESEFTTRRLASIGTYKFVNIEYNVIDSLTSDSIGALEANIFLSPLNKRSIRAELQALTKSNNFAGPYLALTYSNRNLFHGGEILSITGKFGYEVQLTGGNQSGMTSLQFGAASDLIFPRLLFPISIDYNWFKYSIPKTKVGLEVDYINRRKLYSLASFAATFGYIWRANRFVTHELNPIALNYVNLAGTTPQFEEILDARPFLRRSFDQHFIPGLTYSFLYNGMIEPTTTHQFFLNANLDIAGNLVSLIDGGGGNPGEFLGLKYAQYAKTDVDFRYHFKLDLEQTIATRLFAGIGIPYGNSDVMPFSKQYYSGGPYSVRAFRIRSLGPGSYDPRLDENTAYYDQTGNVRLEANMEYRFPLFSYLKGAVFADAGNVWITRENPSLPGGKFGSDFLGELGVGIGTGLRVDIQSFVLRFDLAAPIRTPYFPKGQRWHFGWNEPVFNFAIGYPF